MTKQLQSFWSDVLSWWKMTCPAMLSKVLMTSYDHTSEEKDTWESSLMVLTSSWTTKDPLAWTSMGHWWVFQRFSCIIIVLVSFILCYINMSQVKTMNQCIRVGMKLTNLLMISLVCRIQEHWSQEIWEANPHCQRLGRVKWKREGKRALSGNAELYSVVRQL